MSHAARPGRSRILAALAGLAIAGCGLATAAQSDSPSHIRTINPDAEWSEIKTSRAAGHSGTFVLEIRPTLERSALWGSQDLEAVRVSVLPYASSFWEELSTLLRWRYEAGPYDPAKAREAPQLVAEGLARYRNALVASGLDDVAQDLVVKPGRRVSLTLAAGHYLVLSQAECCSAPIHKVWVWLVRARLDPDATAVVILEDANRLCFDAWTRNGTRCRDR